MTTVALRKVGGSVAMVIPPSFLQALNLQSGQEVDLSIKDNSLQIKPVVKKLTLAELLAQSDFSVVRNEESEAWLNAPAVGDELL